MLIALVGQPNSGKSAILSRLTGARVVTSNYPGTTVELCRGRIPSTSIEVLDTPGIYSLSASTREQEVTRRVLAEGSPDLIVNVVDGSNLGRHLSLTLALKRFGIPLIVTVNCIDRLRNMGLDLDGAALEKQLGARVVATSAATGEGIERLLEEIQKNLGGRSPGGVQTVEGPDGRTAAARQVAEPFDLRVLQRQAVSIAGSVIVPISERQGAGLGGPRRMTCIAAALEDALDRPLVAALGLGAVLVAAWRLISWALPSAEAAVRLLLDPLGTYLGRFLSAALPDSPLSATIADAVTEGLVLPLATVLPAMIVAYSLIAFLEDTGLLARYAAMGDYLTGILNLPGQALIPFMLGFGCRVPGLLSARILPSPESRRSASILIATLVPCTATVSLAWATLARFRGNPLAPSAALFISTLALSRVLRLASGTTKDPLVLEIPPLRMPALRNVVMKTQMRLSGFFTHVLPLVIAVNIVIRLVTAGAGSLGSGISTFSTFSRNMLGIPPQALLGVLLTMLQRYLAPLFLLQQNLTPREATIAVTMVVLGFPCLPSAVTLWREQGASAVMVTFLASTCLFLGWGALLNLVLP